MCSQKEIDEYYAFASLPLERRRLIVYSNFIELFPNSPITRDVLSNKIKLSKPRSRKAVKSKPKQKSLFKQCLTEMEKRR